MPWRVFITAADWLSFDGIDAATGNIPHTYAGCPPSYAEGEEPVSADPDVNASWRLWVPTTAG